QLVPIDWRGRGRRIRERIGLWRLSDGRTDRGLPIGRFTLLECEHLSLTSLDRRDVVLQGHRQVSIADPDEHGNKRVERVTELVEPQWIALCFRRFSGEAARGTNLGHAGVAMRTEEDFPPALRTGSIPATQDGCWLDRECFAASRANEDVGKCVAASGTGR